MNKERPILSRGTGREINRSGRIAGIASICFGLFGLFFEVIVSRSTPIEKLSRVEFVASAVAITFAIVGIVRGNLLLSIAGLILGILELVSSLTFC
jgi:hypothetical protein